MGIILIQIKNQMRTKNNKKIERINLIYVCTAELIINAHSLAMVGATWKITILIRLKKAIYHNQLSGRYEVCYDCI